MEYDAMDILMWLNDLSMQNQLNDYCSLNVGHSTVVVAVYVDDDDAVLVVAVVVVVDDVVN